MSGRFIFRRRCRDETVSFISVVGRIPTGKSSVFLSEATAVILQTWTPLSKQLTVLYVLPPSPRAVSDVETLNPMKRASSTHNFENFRVTDGGEVSPRDNEIGIPRVFIRVCACDTHVATPRQNIRHANVFQQFQFRKLFQYI